MIDLPTSHSHHNEKEEFSIVEKIKKFWLLGKSSVLIRIKEMKMGTENGFVKLWKKIPDILLTGFFAAIFLWFFGILDKHSDAISILNTNVGKIQISVDKIEKNTNDINDLKIGVGAIQKQMEDQEKSNDEFKANTKSSLDEIKSDTKDNFKILSSKIDSLKK